MDIREEAFTAKCVGIPLRKSPLPDLLIGGGMQALHLECYVLLQGSQGIEPDIAEQQAGCDDGESNRKKVGPS